MLARELSDHAAESKVLWNLMLLEYYEDRNREQAIAYGEQSLAIARQFDLQEQLAYTLNDIARAYFVVGKQEQAWAAQKESNGLLRKLGILSMLTDSLITSAGGHYFSGNFVEAQASAEECVSVSKSIGSMWGQAVALYVLGAIYIENGEISKSIDALQEALPMAQQVGFAPPVTIRHRLALFCGMFGDLEHGFEMAHKSIEAGDNWQFSLGAMAQLHLSSGNPGEADSAIQEALRELENGESDPKLGYAIFQVIESENALANHRYDEVLALTERAISVLGEMGQRVFLPDLLRCRGEALLGLERSGEAKEVLTEALAVAEGQSSHRALWCILPVLARIAAKDGPAAEAESLRRRAREAIDYIADHAGTTELRSGFLGSAKVRASLKDL